MSENKSRKKSVGTKRRAFRSSRSDTIDGSDDRGDTGSNDQQLAIKNATSHTDEKHSSSSSSSVPDLVSSSEPSPTNLTPNENTAREVCDRNLTSLEQEEVTNCTGKQKSNTKPGLEKQKSVTFLDSETKKSSSTCASSRRGNYRSSGHGTGESSTEGKSNDCGDDEVFDSDSPTDRRYSYRETKGSSAYGTGEWTTEQDDDESHNSDMIPDFDLLLKESSDAEPSADQNKGLNYPNNMSENYPKNESFGNNHIECFAQSSDHHFNELQDSSEKQKNDHINPVDIHVITSNKNISSDSQNKDKLKELENKDQQDDVGFLKTSQTASHPVPSQNTIQQNWNGNKMESQCSSDSPVKYMACSINQDSSKENSLDTSVNSPPIINTYGVKKLSNINLRISDTEDDSHQPVNRANSVHSQKSVSSMSIEDFLTGLPDDTSIVSTTSQTDDPHKDTQKMLDNMLEENKKEAQIAKLASGQFEVEDESESDDDNTMDNIQLCIEDEDEDEDEDEQLLLETTVKKIAKASQCDVDCCHIDCLQGKNLVQHLQRHLEVEKMLTCRKCDYIVRCIWRHSSSCLEMNCPVAFCGYLCKNDVESVEDAVNCTAQSTNLHMPTYTGKNEIYSTLAIGDLKDLPKMYAVTKLSGFGHCKTRLVHAASKKFWVIKQISQNRNQHLIGVLRRVLPDNHCHIVEHLWASQHEDSLHITICTKFEMPGSLRQHIGLLPVSLKLSCLRQLLDATAYLHALDVIYLLWTSCNIVLDDKCNWKLSNFSSAVFVNYSWQVEEIEDMVMYLPTNIIPPELLNQPPEKPTVSCDIWGMGCLTFEMCMSHKIRHKTRHLSPEEIRERIPLSPCPDISNCENPFQKIMSMCFKDNPAERASVAMLKEHLDSMKMN